MTLEAADFRHHRQAARTVTVVDRAHSFELDDAACDPVTGLARGLAHVVVGMLVDEYCGAIAAGQRRLGAFVEGNEGVEEFDRHRAVLVDMQVREVARMRPVRRIPAMRGIGRVEMAARRCEGVIRITLTHFVDVKAADPRGQSDGRNGDVNTASGQGDEGDDADLLATGILQVRNGGLCRSR
jgi:hypothetical protein